MAIEAETSRSKLIKTVVIHILFISLVNILLIKLKYTVKVHYKISEYTCRVLPLHQSARSFKHKQTATVASFFHTRTSFRLKTIHRFESSVGTPYG
jgi:hypothetical protein